MNNDYHLRESELSLLIDSIEDYAIFVVTPEGRIRSWNRGAEKATGYTAEEAIGSEFARLYEPEAAAAGRPQRDLDEAFTNGRAETEGWRVRRDGTRFWANTILTPLHDRTRGLNGFVSVTRDLTDRKLAEQRLRDSEEMFRLLVASVKEYAIFLLDPTGHIVTWNAGAERIKGYRPSEIIGSHFSRFYSEEEVRNGKPARELEIARETGSVEDVGWRIRKDGTRFWANVVITAVFDEHGQLRGFTKVTRDLTEKKRAEEVQQALLEQREARLRAEDEKRRAEASFRVAQEANRAKDAFLMTLSHELRTPLTSILGWARLLPSMAPDEQQEAIIAISRSAQLQARLIDDVLDVSRIVSGKLRLSVEAVDVEHVLGAAVETVRPSAEAKGITIETECSPGLGRVMADATRLQQVVWNLLTNAVKFTPRQGRVVLSARRTSSHVQISVSDNGTGIDPAFLPHVFEPFRQAETPSTRVHGGLGLGLSIVRYLVEAHGGTIAAESAGRDFGSTFTVTLPVGAIRSEHSASSSDSARLGAGMPKRLETMNILLVDDDDAGRGLVRTVLQRAGANVRTAESGVEALAILGAEAFDLVITDIAMPHMDGYELARQIQQRHPQQKVVALSAFPAGRNGVADAPFDTYLSKPIEPLDLVEAVARVATN
jgi:PAS domain S-box-containing protein